MSDPAVHAPPIRPLVGAIAVISGIAAMPAVSYGRTNWKPYVPCSAKGALGCATLVVDVCGGGSPLPHAPDEEQASPCPDPAFEHTRLGVEKLRPDGEWSTLGVTRDHNLRVTPGAYVIQTPPRGRSPMIVEGKPATYLRVLPSQVSRSTPTKRRRRTSSVSVGQTLEVTLRLIAR